MSGSRPFKHAFIPMRGAAHGVWAKSWLKVSLLHLHISSQRAVPWEEFVVLAAGEFSLHLLEHPGQIFMRIDVVREESKGKPFAIAIADFHKMADKEELGPMTYTQSALWQYLYGSRVTWHFEEDQLILNSHEIGEHEYKGKKIPSGFFDLPDAENVSAVIFSNAGTIAKFDRMGVAAGYGAEGYGYFRIGLKPDPAPNAVVGEAFHVDVSDPDYEEHWTQEIQVFHNPNARYPLPFDALFGATHHYFEDGQLQSHTPNDAVLSSFSMLIKYLGDEDKKSAEVAI